MEHLSAERIAALASDLGPGPMAAESGHLARCRACSDDVAELAAVTSGVRDASRTPLRPPHPDVWAAISAEVGESAPARRPRSWLPVAVAAAAGLVVGVGGVLGVEALGGEGPGSDAVVARTDLAALPGQSGEGSAEIVRAQDALQLRVHATLQSSPGGDYHEVWLINGDGERMYALGVLPSSGDASYWLPTPLAQQLDGYSTVDISLEPDDGVTAHSRHSLVRGTLPG